ncbi:Cytochrome P450 97B3 [Arachis hypogaea]|nr:Cytochrome P450 97B3 [Arachis hypogaea]
MMLYIKLRDDLITMLIAGHETTAAVLTWLLFRFFSLANTILLIIELTTEPEQNEKGSSRGRFTAGYKNTNLRITLKTAVMLATVRCEEIAREKYKAAKEELHQLEEDMKRSPTEYLNRLSSQIDTCLSESLFASKAIKAGDCILKVSYRVQITADNIPAKIKSLISEEVANVAKLAVLLLIEGKLGQDSQWNPYICRLPWQEELHNTAGFLFILVFE